MINAWQNEGPTSWFLFYDRYMNIMEAKYSTNVGEWIIVSIEYPDSPPIVFDRSNEGYIIA